MDNLCTYGVRTRAFSKLRLFILVWAESGVPIPPGTQLRTRYGKYTYTTKAGMHPHNLDIRNRCKSLVSVVRWEND